MALSIQELEKYVISIRRKMHENPEISGEETETIQLITSELNKVDIPYEVIDNGGIVGIIEGGHPGKSIVLRADIDALPMKEDANNLIGPKRVVSKIDTAAHTCGHDAHSAMLLGAAHILKAHAAEIHGRVILAFEQGEEDGRGIYRLLRRLVEIGADGVWGIHMKPDIPSGKVSIDAGPRTASVFPFEVKLTGVGGHGSRLDLAASPLDAFTDFYQKLKEMRMNTLNPFDPITFSMGKVQYGSTHNIISDNLTFGGTFRYLHHAQGIQASENFKKLLTKSCEVYHCSYEYIREPFAADFSIYNEETCAHIAQEVITEALGEDALMTYPAWMASEPFAFYQKYFPGVFAFLGTENKAIGTGADNHHPQFDIDENTLMLGVNMTVAYAKAFLQYDENIPYPTETRPVHEVMQEANIKTE